ncbi:MAG: hypothetical protein Q9225_004295 [Loekoesia sp. 1 TL-2023]
MKLHQLLIPFILSLPFCFSLSILLPLYLYPGPDASAWSDVFSTISSHPTVQFTVVINPNSGPGTASYPTDPNIIAGISKINSYPNTHTVGYVLTGHGSRDIAAVNADVDAYAKWSSSGSNIAINGIYFDEVSSEATSANYDHYQSLAAHARSSMPSSSSSSTQVVFNPGYRAPEQLFAYCDLMVEFEDSYANYQSQNILTQIPASFVGKSAVQIYDMPEGGADVGALISGMAQAGLGAVYLGRDCCYKVWDRGLLEGMANAV